MLGSHNVGQIASLRQRFIQDQGDVAGAIRVMFKTLDNSRDLFARSQNALAADQLSEPYIENGAFEINKTVSTFMPTTSMPNSDSALIVSAAG